jgi:hypothetical protein
MRGTTQIHTLFEELVAAPMALRETAAISGKGASGLCACALPDYSRLLERAGPADRSS